jgi:hypothetical protein
MGTETHGAGTVAARPAQTTTRTRPTHRDGQHRDITMRSAQMSQDMWQQTEGPLPVVGPKPTRHATCWRTTIRKRVRSHPCNHGGATRPHQPTHHASLSRRHNARGNITAPPWHACIPAAARVKTTLTGHTVSFDDMGKFLMSILCIVYAVIFQTSRLQ